VGENPVATAAAVLNNFGTDTRNVELYDSLSLATRLSIAVKSVKTHTHNLKLSYLLWKLNGNAARFFQQIDDIIAGKVEPGADDAAVPVTPENITKAVDALMKLGTTFNGVYEQASRKRLLNNSIIAGPVVALRAHAERFFELAEWCEMFRNTDEIERVFASANEERQRGEVYDLSQV
jgi:hypothetical protein